MSCGLFINLNNHKLKLLNYLKIEFLEKKEELFNNSLHMFIAIYPITRRRKENKQKNPMLFRKNPE